MTRHQLLGTLAALGAITLSISSAQAQTCEATTDCPKSYICSVVDTPVYNCGIANGGAGAATAVNDPSNPVPPPDNTGAAASAGANASDIAPSAGGSIANPVPAEPGGSAGVSICTTTTVQTKECVALTCTSDADCSVGWYCKANTVTSCPTSPAPIPASGTAGAATGAPASAGSGNVSSGDVAAGGSVSVRSTGAGAATSTCVVTTQSATCQPKAQDPCQVPADCGPGYDCVDSTTCVCSISGSAGSGSSSSGPVYGVGGAVSTGGVAIAGNGAVGTAGAPSDTVTAPDCSCGPSGYAYCQPRTIACQTKTDCPETWTCSAADGGATAGTCVSPLSSTTDKGYSLGTAGSQATVTPTTDNPNGTAGSANAETGPVLGTGGSVSAASTSHAASADNASTTSAAAPGSVQGGGCQIGRGHQSRFAAVLMGLLAAFGLRRRRQIA